MADIQTEFGGSNPISLSEYYAGGAYVPAGTSGTYGAVPSSGTISIRNFYGTTKATVNFTDANVVDIVSQPLTASAGYRVLNNGTVETAAGTGNWGFYEQWVTPTSAASNYEIYAGLISGVLTSGTVNTWLALSTTRTWVVERNPVGNSAAAIEFQVRPTGGSVIDTWYVDLNAEVSL